MKGFNDLKFTTTQETNQMEPVTTLPVLPRLDRLDRLLQLLEEKHNLSGRQSLPGGVSSKVEQDDDPRIIPLSSALEEVHHKGTLMERLTMLENRVLQLSLEMNEANNSKSSCSTNIPASENTVNDSVSSTLTTQDNEDKIVPPGEKQGPAAVQEKAYAEADATEKTGVDINRRKRKKASKKWFGWSLMGC